MSKARKSALGKTVRSSVSGSEKRVEPRPKAAKKPPSSKRGSSTLTVASTVERVVYTREEAAAYIGTSPVTLWREAKDGRVGHTLIGKRIRFLREDLDRYVRRESPRPGAILGWEKDEERAERMRQVHAAKKAAK